MWLRATAYTTYPPSAAKLAANARDLNTFLGPLSLRACVSLEPGQVVGPLLVPGDQSWAANLPLLIGKVRRVLL